MRSDLFLNSTLYASKVFSSRYSEKAIVVHLESFLLKKLGYDCSIQKVTDEHGLK